MEKTTSQGALCSVFVTKYHSGDQIRKTEMGRPCSTYVKGRRAYRVWWENLREGDYLKDPGIDGRKILKWIFEKWEGAWTG
jgi:hypothetical protein